MSIAKIVREAKEKNPENYCRNPRCLWRTVTRDGFRACPKHNAQEFDHINHGPFAHPTVAK